METVEKMKQVMQEKGLTEQQLAEAIGVSKGAMHNWMKGVGKPSANAVKKFEDDCAGGKQPAAETPSEPEENK